MQPVEYNHYFCSTCGQTKRDTIMSGPALGIQIEWLEAKPGRKCGEYLSIGTLKSSLGCGQPTTVELKSMYGSPFTHAIVDTRPVLQGGEPRIYTK